MFGDFNFDFFHHRTNADICKLLATLNLRMCFEPTESGAGETDEPPDLFTAKVTTNYRSCLDIRLASGSGSVTENEKNAQYTEWTCVYESLVGDHKLVWMSMQKAD